MSLPPPPLSRLAPIFPIMVLASALPVPLMAAEPGPGCRKSQVLEETVHIPGQFEAEGVDARNDSVHTRAAGLVNDIADIVDEIGVVAGPAQHRIGAAGAVERVVAACARQAVVE